MDMLKLFKGGKKEVAEEEYKPIFELVPASDIPILPEIKNKEECDIRYPLMPPYAYAHIVWYKENNELTYTVEEPELNDEERGIFELVSEGMMEVINISILNIKGSNKVIEYLEKNIKVLLNEFKISISKESFLKMMYYIYRNFIGLNRIEPLMNDYYIEDIECNGFNTPIYIVHRKFRNLRTNIIFKEIKELTSFVEKLAQKCNSYISYANPTLDSKLPTGDRVNATYTQEISSRGPSFTIRKFTKEPWTPVKMIETRTVSPEILAYLWLLIENEANIIVIGGTGSGKTSFLNSIAFFIPPAARVVSIEDTQELQLKHQNWLPSVARAGVGLANIMGQKHGEVSMFDLLKESFRQRPDYVIVGEIRGSIRGDEEIVIIEDGITKRIQIKDLEGKDLSNAYVPTLDKDLKIKLHKIKAFIKHPPRKKLIQVITKTGRKVTVTHDHSLFTAEGCDVKPIESSKLKEGDAILIPASMPCGYNDVSKIKIREYLPDLRLHNAQSQVKKAISTLGQDGANKLLGCLARQYCRRSVNVLIPINKFVKLMGKAGLQYNLDDYYVRNGRSKLMPPSLPVNEDFCRLLGYYISEGHLEKRKVVITNSNKDIINDVVSISRKLFNINPKIRKVYGFGSSNHIEINSVILKQLVDKLCGRTEKKRIPAMIYGLPKNKIFAFLKGAYSGDGSFYKNEISYFTKSLKLAEDIMYLLLSAGIVTRLKTEKNKKIYGVVFKRIEDSQNFLNEIGFIHKKYATMQKGPAHSHVNTVRFDNALFKRLKLTRKYRNLKRYGQCSKYYLQKIIPELNADEGVINFANGDFYLDKVKKLNELDLPNPEPVYDLSINPSENFIGGFGGIVLHNSEAFVLFQGAASGHPTMSTMHAEDVDTLVRRLETNPINLSPELVRTLDAVCVMIQTKVNGKPVRRLREVAEIISVGQGQAATNMPFTRDPAKDIFYFKTESNVFQKIAERSGMGMQQLTQEFRLRSMLLMSMFKKNIFASEDVQSIIHEYYKNPGAVLKRFGILK
jgi:type IV secretory pathway ATPase VirB11/archaellum biosynthesis ATPase/intein/homing endonuclease